MGAKCRQTLLGTRDWKTWNFPALHCLPFFASLFFLCCPFFSCFPVFTVECDCSAAPEYLRVPWFRAQGKTNTLRLDPKFLRERTWSTQRGSHCWREFPLRFLLILEFFVACTAGLYVVRFCVFTFCVMELLVLKRCNFLLVAVRVDECASFTGVLGC